MAATKHITENDIEEKLRKHAGIYSLVAEELGCSRHNIFIRVRDSERLASVMQDVKERVLDIVDGQIIKAIQNGDLATARWYAERQGKARGYGNKLETDIRLSETDIAALVTAFGGDISAMRAFHARLAGTDPDPNSPGHPPAR